MSGALVRSLLQCWFSQERRDYAPRMAKEMFDGLRIYCEYGSIELKIITFILFP